MSELQSLHVVGVHAVEITPAMLKQYEDTLGCEGRDSHFGGLCLVEIQVAPPTAEFDWCEFTQIIHGEPKSKWQVPWDERAIDGTNGRWVFFLHNVDLNNPLETPLGPRALPPPAETPPHLHECVYYLP